MTVEFLQALPAAIQKHLTAWAQQESSDLSAFLQTVVSPEDAALILSTVDYIRETEAALKNSGLPPRVWAGERLLETAPEILEDGPLGDLRNYEPTELGSHIIDLGLAGFSEFASPTVSQIIETVTDAGGENGLDLVTEFFQSTLGDDQERSIFAIIAAIVLKVARAFDIKINSIPLTGAIFIGLRAAKIAYQQAAGILDNDAVFQALEETVAVAAVAVADQIVNHLPNAGAVVGAAIGTLLKNPHIGATAGRTLGEFLQPHIRPIARAGADKIARIAIQKTRAAVGAALKTKKSVFTL